MTLLSGRIEVDLAFRTRTKKESGVYCDCVYREQNREQNETAGKRVTKMQPAREQRSPDHE